MTRSQARLFVIGVVGLFTTLGGIVYDRMALMLVGAFTSSIAAGFLMFPIRKA